MTLSTPLQQVEPRGGGLVSRVWVQITALVLLCGLLPFNYLSNGMNGALDSLLSNSNLIRKVYFPREAIPVASVFSQALVISRGSRPSTTRWQ